MQDGMHGGHVCQLIHMHQGDDFGRAVRMHGVHPIDPDGTVPFCAAAIVGTGHECSFWVVTYKDRKNWVASAPDPVSAHHFGVSVSRKKSAIGLSTSRMHT